MSTILKALKRLEEDRPPKSVDASGVTPNRDAPGLDTGRLPAPDPGAADQLRERILAEEAAALASLPEDEDRSPFVSFLVNRKAPLATGTIVLLAVGFIGYSLASRDQATSTTPTMTPTPPSTSLAGSGAAPGAAPTNISGSAPSPRTASQPPAPVELAAVPEASATSDAPPHPSAERGRPATDPLAAARLPQASRRPPAQGSAQAPAPASARTQPLPSTALAAVTPTRAAASTLPRNAATERIEPSENVALHTSPAEAARKKGVPPVQTPSPAPRSPMRAVAGTSLASAGSTSGSKSESTSGSTSRSRSGDQSASRSPSDSRAKSPTPSASASESTLPSRPRSSASERAPSVVSARAADPSLGRVSESGQTRVAVGASPRARASSPESSSRRDVERIDYRGVPDISVVRTSWHPRAERRTARIRLEANDEVLELHEGDAVGALVVKEISPSSVLFDAGEVEIRRRVGGLGGD